MLEDGTPLGSGDSPPRVALAGGTVRDLVVGVDVADGSRRWIAVNAYPLTDDRPDAATEAVLSFRDVTDLRQKLQETRFQADLLAAVGQAVAVTDPAGHLVYWNAAAEAIYGWTAEEVLGGNALELTVDRSAQGSLPDFGAILGGRSWSGEWTARRRDGSSFPSFVTITPHRDDAGQVAAVIGVSTDITERRRAEEDRRRLSAIVESSGDAIVGLDLDGTVTSWNQAAERLTGATAAQAVGKALASVVAVDGDGPELEDLIGRIVAGAPVARTEAAWCRRDTDPVDVALTLSPLRSEDGTLVGVSAIARDISQQKDAERRLEHHAFHDELTGLPNRALFRDRLTGALTRRLRRPATVAVMFFDLDQFKLINDVAGHSVGDEVLLAVAERLVEATRPDDTVARFGGDEFVVLCELVDDEDARHVAERLAEALARPVVVQGSEIFVTASVGLATARRRSTPDSLLADADAAMYRAKNRGQGEIELFHPSLRSVASRKLATANLLRRALTHDEVVVHYQPIVGLDTGRTVAFEALARIDHPVRGLVPPAEFIGVAEETGLVVPLGEAVLERALHDAARWRREGHDLSIAVNASARQLVDPTFAERLLTTIGTCGIEPAAVRLEVTETALMEDAEALATRLRVVRETGVRIAIDDFGTGQSSLARLKRLPVDLLKVDRAFVDGLGEHSDDTSIVGAIVALSRALGLTVLAEGVETARQLEELVALGCDLGQGYLWSRPMPASEAARWLDGPAADARTDAPSPEVPR